MTATQTVMFDEPDYRFGDTTCIICDAKATVTITLTPDAFASHSCHFCGGERSFCSTHWAEFQQAVANHS